MGRRSVTVSSWGLVILVQCGAGCEPATEFLPSTDEHPPEDTSEQRFELTTLNFVATEDAYVDSIATSSNFGSAVDLGVRLGVKTPPVSAKQVFFKFDLRSLGLSPIYSAKLRLYVTNGTNNGPYVYLTSNAWTESTLTYNNRPALDGPRMEAKTNVPATGYIEWDISSVITGPRKYSIAFSGRSTDEMIVRSREDLAAFRPTLVVTTLGANEKVLSFSPTADTYVDSGNPNMSYGSATTLTATDFAPERWAYLKYSVSGLQGAATRALLRVYVTDGTTNAPAIHTTSTSWAEGTMTWNNRPLPSGGAYVNPTLSASGAYFDFDITQAITGNGTYSFVLNPDSTDSFALTSKEDASLARRPGLHVIGLSTVAAGVPCSTSNDRYCCMDSGTGACETSFLHDVTDMTLPYRSSDDLCNYNSFSDPLGDWATLEGSGPDEDVIVVAPHGLIEESTSEIASNIRATVSPSMRWWAFIGFPSVPCRTWTETGGVSMMHEPWDSLHVTSANYNYAPLINIIQSPTPGYKTVIAIHGQRATPKICVGGKSQTMKDAFITRWNAVYGSAEYRALDAENLMDTSCAAYTGLNDDNPANLGTCEEGLQIELGRSNTQADSIRPFLEDMSTPQWAQFDLAIEEAVVAGAACTPP